MTNKPEFKPCEDAVEALTSALDDVAHAPFDKRFAASLIDKLKERGYTITRAELAAASSDEVEKALDQPLYDFGDGEERYLIKEDDWKTLRAHIAALTKEIETTKRTTAGHYLTWQCTEAGLREEITALEAESKRLREALQSGNNTYLGGQYIVCIKPEIVEAALAQTYGKAGD